MELKQCLAHKGNYKNVPNFLIVIIIVTISSEPLGSIKHIDTEMIKKGDTFVPEMHGICFLS